MATERRAANQDGEPTTPRRLPYTRPHIEVLGDVHDLTLGGTPGIGDSGDPLNRQPPG